MNEGKRIEPQRRVGHYKNTDRHIVGIPEGEERKGQKEHLKKPWLKTSSI